MMCDVSLVVFLEVLCFVLYGKELCELVVKLGQHQSLDSLPLGCVVLVLMVFSIPLKNSFKSLVLKQNEWACCQWPC